MNYAPPGQPSWPPNGFYNPAGAQHAFIPVTARQSFTASPGLPPPPTYVPEPLSVQNRSFVSPSQPPATRTMANVSSSTSAKPKTNWSPAIRDYVNRSFAQEHAIEGIARAELEAKLKKVITDAAQSGNLEIVNWKELPLPQQMIQEERNRTILNALTPTSFHPQVSPSSTQNLYHHLQSETLRKRKSSEISTDLEDVQPTPPWKVNNKKSGTLADRVTFNTPDKRPKADAEKNFSKFNSGTENRKKRFEDSRAGSYSPNTMQSSRAVTPESEKIGPVVGRCQKLEKNYFRLTSAPNPDDVRPLDVLRKTLELLKKKWRSDSNYTYICDQFKSLRQDLTVQHIKNDFTTNVYEIHARIALEKGDLGEYNQCQTQLRALYRQNLGGHPIEFKAYRILYFIHTCNRTDMNDVLSDLTPTDKTEPAIKHALQVRSALALGNYHKFFKLYLSVPNMGAYLMDMFVERERLAALSYLCKAYKPDIRLRFITEELAFEHDEEAAQFILGHSPEGSDDLLQERDGHVRLLTGKVGSMFESARSTAFRQIDIKGQI